MPEINGCPGGCSTNRAGYENFTAVLCGKERVPLTPRQEENCAALLGLSADFCHKAGVTVFAAGDISPVCIVLESGHQPNFLPHAGTWKKAFLLDRMSRILSSSGHEVIPFFGFADQNLSTAKLLYRNHVPALNKTGEEVIGFRIADRDSYRSFSQLPKPAPDLWEKETGHLVDHYRALGKARGIPPALLSGRLSVLLEIMESSYEKAPNFAGLNAGIFAGIASRIFGLSLAFFQYSDLQKNQVFCTEFQNLLCNARVFNETYNAAVAGKKLRIPPVPPGSIPFWYHCCCGAKLNLSIDGSGTGRAVCPRCNHESIVTFGPDFEDLDTYYGRMDFTAVSRNLVLAGGLGTGFLVTGTGGSIQYGEISHAIAEKLRLPEPVTVCWQFRDYYLGSAHLAALRDLKKTLGCPVADIAGPHLQDRVGEQLARVRGAITHGEELQVGIREMKTRKNLLHGFLNQLSTIRNIFLLTPSAIDIFVHTDPLSVPALWQETLENAALPGNGRILRLNGDVTYPVDSCPGMGCGEIHALHHAVEKIGGVL